MPELVAQASGLMIGMTGFGTGRVAELLLPMTHGIGLKSLRGYLDGVERRTEYDTTRRFDPHPLGTFAIHGVQVAWQGRLRAILVLMELQTGWVWAKMVRHRNIELDEVVEALYSLLEEMSIGGARIPLREICLACYETRARARKGFKVKALVGDVMDQAWYPSVIREPDELLVKKIKGKLRRRDKKVRFSAVLLPENFRAVEPLDLSLAGVSHGELNQHVKELTKRYNATDRETFPRSKGPVSPRDRLCHAVRQHRVEASRQELQDGAKAIQSKTIRQKINRKSGVMTKADLVEKVQLATGFTGKESSELLESTFELIKKTLESGENLKISGFGSFDVRAKNPRRGRNPQTGDAIEIAPRKVLTFKPSALLKQALNLGSRDGRVVGKQ